MGIWEDLGRKESVEFWVLEGKGNEGKLQEITLERAGIVRLRTSFRGMNEGRACGFKMPEEMYFGTSLEFKGVHGTSRLGLS